MGVLIDEESTVMTSSHGMSRPKGANCALNFFGGGVCEGISGNRLIGGNAGVVSPCLPCISVAIRDGLSDEHYDAHGLARALCEASGGGLS